MKTYNGNAVRLIHTVADIETSRVAKVYYCHADNEYIVHLYESDKLNKEASYFTDDKQDALSTADHMIGFNGN